MPNISELLQFHNIIVKDTAPGRYYTTCPHCSASRKPPHRKLKCLGVTIREERVYWGCNHCGITGPEKAPPRFTYDNGFKTKSDGENRFFWRKDDENDQGDPGPFRINEALESDGVILIAEGEKDVNTLWALGFPATCGPHGASTWKPDYSARLKGRDIVVMNDNDAPGYKYAKLVVDCSLAVARSVRRLDLKEFWPEIGEGEDVSDWIDHGDGSTEWLETILADLPLINGADTTETTKAGTDQQPSRLLWFKDIKAREDSADFVQGLLVEHSFCVVYGASGSGKTFWTTTLALNLAAGLPFAGRRVEPSGVIYCVLEGTFGFANRVDAWRREHHMVGKDLPFAAIPHSLNMMDGESINRLCADCKAAQAKMSVPLRLIVIDTLARALAGGNENAPDDMGRLVMHTDYLRRQTGAAVLYIHHCGKNAANGARGHSSLQAAVDTEIEITDDGERHTAALLKQRDMGKGWTTTFTLKSVDIGLNRWDELVTTCVVTFPDGTATLAPKKKLTGQAKRAHELLAELIRTSGEQDHPDAPEGTRSVPEQQWRDLFYDKAMMDAAADAKQKAFRRAAYTLLENHRIDVEKGRIWLKT